MNVREIYQESIKPLSAVDRLQLAKMILNDIPAESLVDFSDSWTDEDLTDFAQSGWQHMDKIESENA
jgi:hypothetical protein